MPAVVRQKLGVGPGSVLEWVERDGELVVRRGGRFSSDDVHRALFPDGTPAPRRLEELKAGIASHVRSRRARR